MTTPATAPRPDLDDRHPVPMGITAYVLRPSHGDCTNGGLTSRVDRVVLIGRNVPQVVPADADTPAVTLVERTIAGRPMPYVVPTDPPAGASSMAGPMMGGNFIWSTDSRFPTDAPLAVHDRYETWDLHDALSR